MSQFHALEHQGCPAEVATELAPHLAAHNVDGAKLVPAALLPTLNWAGLAGIIQKFGLPLVLEILKQLAPVVTAAPAASQVPGGSPKVPGT